MTYFAHRVRAEEKKALRKVIFTFIVMAALFIALIFGGLSVLANIILFFTSFRKETTTTNSSYSLILPPTFNPVYDATNSSRISLSGYGEKDATVKIRVNNREQAKAATDSEGKFTAINIVLSEGPNTITALNLKDSQESTTSSPITIIYKKNAPKLEINYPKDGDKIANENRDITVTGMTDPGARVTVNDRMAITSPNGSFDFRMRLNDGENVLKFISTDEATNRTEKEIRITLNPN